MTEWTEDGRLILKDETGETILIVEFIEPNRPADAGCSTSWCGTKAQSKSKRR
jgi:hypothetical protein